MIERKEYIEQLISWKDEAVIKVVTGIRRCGKSTLLLQYMDWLKAHGTGAEQIVYVNLEDLAYEELLEYRKLYQWIKERLLPGKMTYVFLDEIQKVPSFEKAVDSLQLQSDVDIYMTGSNAYMLSSDLATLLSGRYVEISMLPLSFKEYAEAVPMPVEKAFAAYLKTGGFPYIAMMQRTDEKVDTYLEGIYNTVIVRDIEERQGRREQEGKGRKVTDIVLLKSIARYLASVIGSPVSGKKVTDYLISSGRKVSANTINDYLTALSESFIFYPVERFDIIGKHLLTVNKKMYMVDLGLRNHILPRRQYDFGFSIENVVYFELLRRGYQVNIGKLGSTEVDFVCQKQGVLTYFQVTADMRSQETFAREMRPLRSIPDNYEKIILTMDTFSEGNYDGIQVVYLLDWLLGKR